MADEFTFNNSAPMDLATGMCTYKGQQYTYQELMDLWEEERFAIQDQLAELRDFNRDGDQNLWGRKQGGRSGAQYYDDWMGRKKPYRRRKGYPSEL